MVLVRSLSQLNNRRLRHTKGKLVVSLIRKSEVVSVLLNVLTTFCTFKEDCELQNMATSFCIANAFVHLGSIELNLLQQLTPEQQALIYFLTYVRLFDCFLLDSMELSISFRITKDCPPSQISDWY